MHISNILQYALLCTVSLACNPDKGDESGGNGPDGEPDETADPGDECGPWDVDGSCPPIDVSCYGDDEPVDEDALACALAAMRDRAPKQISLTTCMNGGQFEDDYSWQISTDGTARRGYSNVADFCWLSGERLVVELETPTFYDACLANTDWQAQVDCLLTPAVIVEVCDPGAEGCDDIWDE